MNDMDTDFGPFDRSAWEETVGAAFPEHSGLVPCIAPVAAAAGVLEWHAELLRPTPLGPDRVDCGTWHDQRSAWAACVAQALVMCWHAIEGRRELAEQMFTHRAARPLEVAETAA